MRAAVALVVLALGVVAPARGAIDANGKWSVRAQGTSGLLVTVACLVDIAQSGTSFAVTGSCELVDDVSLAGTFDPAAGSFTASGHSEYYCSTLTIAGTVAADGASFTGRFDCRGGFSVSGTFVGSRCGNGLLDAGEQCDDGNRVDGDCCSSSCAFEATGGACSDDGDPCTDYRCDGAGRCTYHPAPDDFPCDAGDDCTLGGTCTQGVCVPGTPAPAGTLCAGSFDPCRENVCDGAGTCTHRAKPDGSPCTDWYKCTLDDACQGGVCVPGTPAPAGTLCAGPFDPCGENACDGAGTCTHRAKPDGSPCTDWDDCTRDDACQGGMCRGTPMACGPCQACVPRLGCASVSAPGCPPPKPARLPVTCRDGAPGAVFAYFGGPACMPYCDVDDKRDSVCTFRIPIAHGVEACRVKERVIAVPVGHRRRISGGDCRRPGEPSSGGYRLILHCRPHRQTPICSLPVTGQALGHYG